MQAQPLAAMPLTCGQNPLFKAAETPATRLRCRSPAAAAARAAGEDDHQLSRRAALVTSGSVLAAGQLGMAGTAAGAPFSTQVAPQYGLIGDVAAAAADAAVAVPRTQLADGLQVSQVIKGCWQLSGGHRGDAATDRTSGSAAVADLNAFAAAGVTTFDTADHYGASEALIGRYLASTPGARERCQVLTKVCFFGAMQYSGASKDYVNEQVEQRCARLGMPTLDEVQFYWSDYAIKQYVPAMLRLADAQAAGRIRALGTTNFDVPRLREFADAGVKMASVQCQYSLLDTRPENGMSDFAAANGMQLLPYGVLAGGFLSDKYLGLPFASVKLDTYSKSKYARVIFEAGGWEWFQRLLAVLEGVGAKHGVSIADVAARWVLQRPAVGALVLGARNALHVDDWQRLFAFELDDEDNDAIAAVQRAGRRPRGDCYSWERGGAW